MQTAAAKRSVGLASVGHTANPNLIKADNRRRVPFQPSYSPILVSVAQVHTECHRLSQMALLLSRAFHVTRCRICFVERKAERGPVRMIMIASYLSSDVVFLVFSETSTTRKISEFFVGTKGGI